MCVGNPKGHSEPAAALMVVIVVAVVVAGMPEAQTGPARNVHADNRPALEE